MLCNNLIAIVKLRIGPPVTGEDFYPRPQLIKTLTRALHGGHVAFLGPRRTGKTSCVNAIVAEPPDGRAARWQGRFKKGAGTAHP